MCKPGERGETKKYAKTKHQKGVINTTNDIRREKGKNDVVKQEGKR